MIFDFEMISNFYTLFPQRVDNARKILNRPMSFTEKVLYAHVVDALPSSPYKKGIDYVHFQPERVAMQDATAQMALLQFIQSGRQRTAVPSTVHCDHLILGKEGKEKDLPEALKTNKEVYDFLQSAAKKYGIGFWKPGAGIIHQVLLENYAFPGGMMIGTDSHTVNAGGLGMIAIGVGGADAVDVMAGIPWELKFPKLIGVHLTGTLSGWTSAKDVILKVAGMLSVKGGTGYIIEYFGEGALSLSCTGKATICNMGAEVGATTSVFGYDKKMSEYLRATGRKEIADMADTIAQHLTGDAACYADPEKYFDKVIPINLSELEPHVNGPFTPDKAVPISQLASFIKENGYPEKLEAALIGSCTNSSYEDLSRAASLLQQATEKKIRLKSDFIITPGSEQVRYTIERDDILDLFTKSGGMVLANACGPCIGQWARKNVDTLGPNAVITSFNRNFAKRTDGNPNTHVFVASPEIVTALALAGSMTFNPLTDKLINEEGKEVMLDMPHGQELPSLGFDVKDKGYEAPAHDGSCIQIIINQKSERLQLLDEFAAWDGKDFDRLYLLIKVKGKCTTDHISMAGPWLRYRGHLDNISNNLLIGATNYFNDKTNSVKNQINGHYEAVPDTARAYKQTGKGSIIIGDDNYGEGSSREHAAMEPRHLGVKAVLVKSFARIHETNLKKQGILALTFADKNDYYKIQEDDRISIKGLSAMAEGKNINVILHHADGSKESISAAHSYNSNQIEWFKAGSALNLIKKKV